MDQEEVIEFIDHHNDVEIRRSLSRGTTPRLVIARSGSRTDSLSSSVQRVVSSLVRDVCTDESPFKDPELGKQFDDTPSAQANDPPSAQSENSAPDAAGGSASNAAVQPLTQMAIDLILEQYSEPPQTVEEEDVLDLVAEVNCTCYH